MAIHIALAKGRIHKVVMKYLAESGYDFPTYSEESRKLIFEDAKGQLKVTLVKSPDVAVYVERGAADVGIVGKDVLIEEAPGADVYEVMDLGIGRPSTYAPTISTIQLPPQQRILSQER